MEIKACDYAHAIFQSALPRGERHGASVEYKPTMTTISIRAPARGATYNLRYIYFSRIFQSALPRGERRVDTNLAFHMFLFQSALPRGERRKWTLDTRRNKAFQSALPRGERPRYPSARSFPGVISIRAPARGATHGRRQTGYITKFQSALPRGERQVDRVSFCM